MFLTRKHLSRREVLKGAGATIALPLLDAMIPARTALAQTVAAASPRLGFVYFPHGALQDEWQPTKTGRDFDRSGAGRQTSDAATTFKSCHPERSDCFASRSSSAVEGSLSPPLPFALDPAENSDRNDTS